MGAGKRDSFLVNNSHGAVQYTVTGAHDYTKTKTMKDAHGTPVLVLNEVKGKKKDKLTIHYPTGGPILNLHKSSAPEIGVQKQMKGFLGETELALVINNHKNVTFNIFAKGRLLGTVTRKKASLKKMFTAQDSYTLLVRLGSPALLSMLVVAIDEFYSD